MLLANCKLYREEGKSATGVEDGRGEFTMVLSLTSARLERMQQMSTAVLEHETVTVPEEDVGSAIAGAASPAKQSRSITLALMFLIGCVTLMMTGFAIIMPVFPQRLQALAACRREAPIRCL